MATVRIEKSANYTTLSNRCLDDEQLSLKAVGLLTYMLRLPDNWDFTLEWLAKKHKDGLSSIRSAMTELEAAGYVIRGDQRRDSRGNFQGSDYIVLEEPAAACPVTACENRTRTACENPMSENPMSENPMSENRTQLNTKIPNTKKPNPPEAPQGAAPEKASGKSTPKWKPERFEKFWTYYPALSDGRKPARVRAVRAWDKLRPTDDTIDQMATALRRQKQSEQWKRGIGIPYASSWLNGRAWEEEYIPPELTDEDEPYGDYAVDPEGLEAWT